MFRSSQGLLVSIVLISGALSFGDPTGDVSEYEVKRDTRFTFARKPTIVREKDRTTISFATDGFCDVTVAVEERIGDEPRIVRHLASGVLGPSAPVPFKKDSLAQTLVWDGKDDLGQYLDSIDRLQVRVSLGLKPRFERNLLWTPKRRLSKLPPCICPTPEGVYVLDGRTFDHLRLFDHDGNYVRTVFPFPSAKIREAKGLYWHTFPQDGRTLPIKANFYQVAMLTSGDNMHHGIIYQPDKKAYRSVIGVGHYHPVMAGTAATAMAVRDGRIALAALSLNRLSTDGATARSRGEGNERLPLSGPGLACTERLPRFGTRDVRPRSAAFSPDGKTLYLSGYYCKPFVLHHNLRGTGLHVVTCLGFENGKEMRVFAGSTKYGESGSENGQFRFATSVACDSRGRVYVTDFMNDRLQVFSPDGENLKNIPTPRPMKVCIDPKQGDIWVASWRLDVDPKPGAIAARLTHYGPFDAPKKIAAYPLSFERYNVYHGGTGHEYALEMDFHTAPPTAWQIAWGSVGARGIPAEKCSIRLLQPKGNRLVKIRDFGADTREVMPTQAFKPRSRLYVNPKNGMLYVASLSQPDHGTGANKAFPHWLKVDPETGRAEIERLPMDAEDAAFDAKGRAYLRGMHAVARFDSTTWREIPWDYGEERKCGFMNKRPHLMSVLPTSGGINWHMGGIAVSPRGHLAVTAYVDARKIKKRRTQRNVHAGTSATGYQPRIFPGRSLSGHGAIIHVWDEHGKLIHEDAVPGLNVTHGIGIDSEDSIYVLDVANRHVKGKPYYNDAAGTLLKFRPGKGRLLSGGGVIPLAPENRPGRPRDLRTGWVEDAEWMCGGIGWYGQVGIGCDCINCLFALDCFGRSFAPEMDRYSVAVLDSNGNVILRVGTYGNVDDGLPLIADGGPPNPRSIGNDEVGLFHGAYVATHTDRRLFISDVGNSRVLSVKLGYHASEALPLGEEE